MDVIVTEHAAKRTKNRVGLSKKLADKNAAKALECGITHADTKGALKRYLDKLYLSARKANNLRIYHHHVYLFHDNTLITIMDLPNQFKRLVDEIQKQKEDSGEDC